MGRARADLLEDGRYAAHSFPHLPDGTLDSFRDDELAFAGSATAVLDPARQAAVASVHNDTVGEDDALFELDLARASHKTRVGGSAVYRRWRSGDGQ